MGRRLEEDEEMGMRQRPWGDAKSFAEVSERGAARGDESSGPSWLGSRPGVHMRCCATGGWYPNEDSLVSVPWNLSLTLSRRWKIPFTVYCYILRETQMHPVILTHRHSAVATLVQTLTIAACYVSALEWPGICGWCTGSTTTHGPYCGCADAPVHLHSVRPDGDLAKSLSPVVSRASVTQGQLRQEACLEIHVVLRLR